MPASNNDTTALEKQLLALKEEVDALRNKNTELDERIKAYSLINSGQISLINKLIDKVPFGVMLLDENSIIIHANAAAEKIFSTSVSELIGQHGSEYFSHYSQSENSEKFHFDHEIKLQQTNADSKDRYVMHSSFVSDEGSEKIIVESFVDVTQIKQAEEELIKVSQVKDEFLGMISHELRTPLNIIQGYSSLLEEELKNVGSADATLYIGNIHRAGEMLLDVVNNLLELSDLTAGKIHVDNIPIDLEMILTQLQYRLEKDFEGNNNEFISKHENIKPFEQDLALLMKVLYELLINANKFTESGKVGLSVYLETNDEIERLCFEITDTGCGMTEDTIKQIFTAFHQADSSLTRSYEGLGLGLTLVEKIVKIIRGHIEVESEVGKGSKFVISVPYKPVRFS